MHDTGKKDRDRLSEDTVRARRTLDHYTERVTESGGVNPSPASNPPYTSDNAAHYIQHVRHIRNYCCYTSKCTSIILYDTMNQTRTLQVR